MAKPKARIAEGRAAQPTPAAATVASAFAQARPRESHPRGSDRPRPRHPNFSPQLKISGFEQTRRSERCSRDALRHAGRGRRVIHRPILPAQAPESAKIGSWAVRGRSRRAGKRCVSVFSAVTAASAGAAASLRPLSIMLWPGCSGVVTNWTTCGRVVLAATTRAAPVWGIGCVV